jgi:hypothetical protein
MPLSCAAGAIAIIWTQQHTMAIVFNDSTFTVLYSKLIITAPAAD